VSHLANRVLGVDGTVFRSILTNILTYRGNMDNAKERSDNLRPEKKVSDNRKVPIRLAVNGQASVTFEKLSGNGFLAEDTTNGKKFSLSNDEDINEILAGIVTDASNAVRNAFLKDDKISTLDVVISVTPYEGQPHGHRIATAHRDVSQRYKVHDPHGDDKHEKEYSFNIGPVKKCDDEIDMDDKDYKDGIEHIYEDDEKSSNEAFVSENHIDGKKPKVDSSEKKENAKTNIK